MAYRFGDYLLDGEGRRLMLGDRTVPLSPRYFDALHLLVAEAGALVTKDRFIDEVWAGVPVTDEALTQCVRVLRRALGDAVSAPRFIETAPKHGYRFIAPVQQVAAAPMSSFQTDKAQAQPSAAPAGFSLRFGLYGMLGGAAAGLAGGLVYGGIAASASDMGAGSVLLVLSGVNVLMGLIGAAGVAFGMVAGHRIVRGAMGLIAGGALGGLFAGSATKLFALDVFALLFGTAPSGMTGGAEGFCLGAAVAAGAVLGARLGPARPAPVVGAGLAGAAAAVGIVSLGGLLMGGSLQRLSAAYAGSRLQIEPLAVRLASDSAGRLAELALAAIEGLVFAGCLVGAIVLAGHWPQRADR